MPSQKACLFGVCALISTLAMPGAFAHKPLRHHHHRHLMHDLDAEVFSVDEEVVDEEWNIKRDVNVYFSSTYPATAAQATAINTPVPVSTTMLGNLGHSPASQYLAVPTQALPTMSPDMLVTQINPALVNNFPLWNGTGTLSVNSGNQDLIHPLLTTPSYCRDGGKGGSVNGYHMFIFADTNTFTAPSQDTLGNFTGAVSNSVAVDVGMQAANGTAPVVRDMMGSMGGPKGNLRTFIPFTEGEAAFNAQNRNGSRYAIWPGSSLIPLNPTTSLLYAPLVFQNITNGGWMFSQAGTTLCQITVPSIGGPVANRVAPMLFGPTDIQLGAIGGVRSYGPSGYQGGNVYIFGKVNQGLILGRAPSTMVAQPNAYQWFYPGVGWNSTRPQRSATNTFHNGSFSSVDVFYSPRHLTFIMIFMDNYVDNLISWKYLLSPPILPTYAGGNMSDIAKYLTMYQWSPPKILINIPRPPVQFSYTGGAHLGYFGADDISRGGTQMLLSWTWPNGQNAASLAAGYDLQTAVVTWT